MRGATTLILTVPLLVAGCELLDLPGLNGQGWAPLADHPCLEYRIDALFVEDGGDRLWVGCGSGASGFGLHLSDDGGRTWGLPRTEPPDYFATFRTNHVTRGPDGLLYVAGAQNPGSDMVVTVDTDAVPSTVRPALRRGSRFDQSFQVGTFQIASDGSAVAESLTGHGVLVRSGFDGDFVVGSGWANDGGSYQILGSALHDDRYYGSGSTIADRFRLFVPPAEPADRFTLDVVTFDGTRGELWGVAVDDGGVAAAGVEQTSNHAVVAVGPTGGREPSDFDLIDLRPALRQDAPSRLYGICRRGDAILALGDYSRRSHALAVLSRDGGATFREVTTGAERGGEPAPILDRCAFLDDGSAIVAGGMGFIARFHP